MKKIIYLMAFGWLTACYQEVDLHVPFEGSKMVLAGYISPGKGLELEIRKSFDPYQYTEFDDNGYHVAGARVLIYQAGQLIDSCRAMSKGRYLSLHPDLYSAGDTYDVRVTAPDVEEVYAEDIRIPEETLVDPDSFTFQMTGRRDYLHLTVLLQNRDHYTVYRARSWYDSRAEQPLDTWVSRFQHIIDECEGDNLLYVSNKCEAEPAFEKVFRAKLNRRVNPGEPDEVFLPKSYVYFEVGQVEPRFRDYVETATASDEPFIEPKLNPGNVEGGYGYIVGWNPVGFTYKL